MTGALVLTACVAAGCDDTPSVAPVAGEVLYKGKPLPFGFVVFQPDLGQPAQAEIQDGRFRLSTFKLNDGAIVGSHRISVSCYQGHNPAVRDKAPAGQVSLGKSLIPVHYSRVGTSGLTAEVPAEGIENLQLTVGG